MSVLQLISTLQPTVDDVNEDTGLTSALKSTYRLLNRKLRVGDTAHFVIQAKDSQGRNKTSGGDFWFPVLTSDTGAYPTKGGRTAGRVVDYNNGTYSVFFYAGWEGTAYVHITLAAPSEATKWLRKNYWPIEKRVFWVGKFSGQNRNTLGKRVTETIACYLLRNVRSSELCMIDYNPKAMGLTALYCQKPKMLECDDFQTVQLQRKMTEGITEQLLGKNIQLFDR